MILNAEYFEALAIAATDMSKLLDERHQHLASNALIALAAQADVIGMLIDTGAISLTCKSAVKVPEEDRESPEWLAEVMAAHGSK